MARRKTFAPAANKSSLKRTNRPYREILSISDLFSLGECRDLLFNVNERHTTLPELHRFIAENGLRLLGFMVSEKIAHAYAQQFGDDPEMINLDYWNQFERDNANSFGASYDFWVQKPDTRS